MSEDEPEHLGCELCGANRGERCICRAVREACYGTTQRRPHPHKLGDIIDGKRVVAAFWEWTPQKGHVPMIQLKGEADPRAVNRPVAIRETKDSSPPSNFAIAAAYNLVSARKHTPREDDWELMEAAEVLAAAVFKLLEIARHEAKHRENIWKDEPNQYTQARLHEAIRFLERLEFLQ